MCNWRKGGDDSLHRLPFLQLHIRQDQLVPFTGVNFQAVYVSVLTCPVLRHGQVHPRCLAIRLCNYSTKFCQVVEAIFMTFGRCIPFQASVH